VGHFEQLLLLLFGPDSLLFLSVFKLFGLLNFLKAELQFVLVDGLGTQVLLRVPLFSQLPPLLSFLVVFFLFFSLFSLFLQFEEVHVGFGTLGFHGLLVLVPDVFC